MTDRNVVPAPCGCAPGNDLNGWHETRSHACKQEELDSWKVVHKIIDEMRYEEYKKTHSRFDCLVKYPDQYFEDAWTRAEQMIEKNKHAQGVDTNDR